MPLPPEPNTASLLARVRSGDSGAISQLLRRQGDELRRWARGRIPSWARGLNDTVDLVQDALLQTFQRLDTFEDRGKGALQGFLRKIVKNRIIDQTRRVKRRPTQPLDDERWHLVSSGGSPLDELQRDEWERRYKQALLTLTPDEQVLVVGRLELGLTFEQLLLTTGRSTTNAVRVAARRAVEKLARRMAGA